jgi:hypothetical protein
VISYTTTANVFAIGDVQNPSAGETSVMDACVIAVSRQLDSWLNQVFAQQTYTAQIYRAQIDPDGLLQCWPACPTMQAPSAIAWKRGFDTTWTDISSATYEIEQSNSGCQFRVLLPNLLAYRGTRVQMRLTFTGGWADLNSVPADFEWGARRACWIEYKKRDQADMGKTAIPELGMVVTPGAWPEDIKRTFANYKRVVLI